MAMIGTIPITTTGMTDPIQMRHEWKHQISPPEDLVLSGRLRQLLMQLEIFLLQGVQPRHVVPADNAVYPSQRGGPERSQLRQGQQKRGQHQRHGPAPTPPAAA